jgi:hypothetical protein
MSWDSNGDIVAQTVQIVDEGPITVSGKIDDHSTVVLVCTDPKNTVTVTGKVDNHSSLTIDAKGPVILGQAGGDDGKVDGGSSVDVTAGGAVTLGGPMHDCAVTLRAHGPLTATGGVDYGARVRLVADGNIVLTGDVQGNEWGHGPSRVELVSDGGSVTVTGKIGGKSSAWLTAAMNASIGSTGPQDPTIDGESFVVALAGGTITLGGGIHDDNTTVDLAAAGAVTIGKDVSAGVIRLLSTAGSISVTGKVSPKVTSWPPMAFTPKAGDTAPDETEWADPALLTPTGPRAGYWWENWGKTFGYVAPFRSLPRTLGDLVKAVQGTGNVDRPDLTPVKAVGGGWSFSDAALPFTTPAEVDAASVLRRGEWQHQDVRNVLEGRGDIPIRPMDLHPQAVTRNVAFSTMFDRPNLRQVTSSGPQLPASGAVRIIDTRALASSLQGEFERIRAKATTTPGRPRRPHEILFHVEAGITMSDLQQLLDHQFPRLAIQATGGSPGATLAGTLSTATHGGEFQFPLLVDRVRAIHLIGPGGVQWWIEGDEPVADPKNLALRYNGIRFIGAGWSGIPGLGPQDVLRAVAVSMGTMGVIYSVVLSVVPQFGLRQVVHPTTWPALLAAAKTSEDELRKGTAAANQAVLDALRNGMTNGTGIPDDGSPQTNVYIDLAINPLNQDCWIVNRQVTPALPDDPDGGSGAGDFLSALPRALGARDVDRFQDSVPIGRIFDFLSWATNTPDLINTLPEAGRLAAFVGGLGDPLGGVLAAGSAQAVLNALNVPGNPDRGLPFVADLLTGFFHALEGTTQGQNPDGSTREGGNADITNVAYRVGAIGWPDSGLPGRGLEVALDPANAFSFLQTQIFDDVLAGAIAANDPLFGYISVRVCPQTETLLGMQQFGPVSVMIEVVSYRSPEAAGLIDAIQDKAKAWSPGGAVKPLLHWGLENDRLSAADLAATPLGQPYAGGMTRLQAFSAIRQYLLAGHAPVFDNTFVTRLGL